MSKHAHVSAFVVVRCPDCGDGRVEARAVTVRSCTDNDDWSYRFTCASCGVRAVASTARIAALRAMAAGATFETWSLPEELDERFDGEQFCEADVAGLVRSVEDPRWLSVLAGRA